MRTAVQIVIGLHLGTCCIALAGCGQMRARGAFDEEGRSGVRLTHARGAGLCLSQTQSAAFEVERAETVVVDGRRATSLRLAQDATRQHEIFVVTVELPEDYVASWMSPGPQSVSRRLHCAEEPEEEEAIRHHLSRVCQLTVLCDERAFFVTAYRPPDAPVGCRGTSGSWDCDEHRLLEAVRCHGGLDSLSLPIRSGDQTVASLDLEPGRQACDVSVEPIPERWRTHDREWQVTTTGREATVVLNQQGPAPAGRVRGSRLASVFGTRQRFIELDETETGAHVLHHREHTPGAQLDLVAHCPGASCGAADLSVFEGADLIWAEESSWIARASAGLVWLPESGTFGGIFDFTFPLYRIGGDALLSGLHVTASRVETSYFLTIGAALELDLSYFWRRLQGGRDRVLQLVLGAHVGLAAAVISDGANTFVSPGFDLSPYLVGRIQLGESAFIAPRLELGWAFGDTTRTHVAATLGAGARW